MEPGAVPSSCPSMERVVTNDGMLSVRIIIICFKNVWGVGIGGQRNNRLSRGKKMASGSRSEVYWALLFS